jgi:ABC-2 type transport system ATP-binding protein
MNAKYKTTVILTTHDMQDIENLCSRIIMIEKGEIIYDGKIEDIKHYFGNIRTIAVALKEQPDNDSLNKFDNKASYEWKDEKLYIKFDADKLDIKDVVNYIFDELNGQDMQIHEINIEDVVKSIMSNGEVHI